MALAFARRSTWPRPCGLLLALALCLSGCGSLTEPPVTPTPTGTVAAPSATAMPSATVAPTATPTVAPSATVLPTATVAPTATPMPTLPPSTRFEGGWDDLTPFFQGVRPEEQGVLSEVAGATVYHLDIEIADDYQRVTGREELRYTNQEAVALTELFFRLFPNLLGGKATISDLTVNGVPVDGELQLEGSALRVPLAAPLEPGDQVVIALAFEVTIPTTQEGNYGSFAFTDGVLALAHFYPMIPVYDDEGWNVELPAEGGDIVYADSSFYRVRVSAPAAATVIGSGVVVAQQSEGARQTLTFAAAPMRDFYLVMSENYTKVSTQVGETTLNSYAFPDEMGVAQQALDIAAAAFQGYERRLGPYPFTELDVAATPNQALGIEYPGIVVITDRLYDQAQLGGGLITYLESTVAHEVGHQWFYSLIGNDQLDEPWLDESLTQYITYLYFQDQGDEAGAQGFYDSLRGRWSRVGNEPIPIGQPVAAFTQAEYSAIVYGRGPLFFEALAATMGQPAFDEALRRYVAENRFGIATGDTLKRVAEESCRCNLTTLWEEWIDEQ